MPDFSGGRGSGLSAGGSNFAKIALSGSSRGDKWVAGFIDGAPE
jgi:hypothetical protein